MVKIFTPHLLLQPYIEHYVYAEFGTSNEWNLGSLAPPGFNALTVVLGSDTYRIRVNQEKTQQYPSPVFTGQITTFSDIRLFGRLKVFFVTFRPCGAFRLLGIPQHECTGKSFHLTDLLGTRGKYFSEELINQTDAAKVYNLVDGFFIQRLSAHKKLTNLDQLVYITEQIRLYSHSSKKIDQVCDQEGYSQSRLERHMKETVGMGPKKFQRIMRFNNTFSYIKNNQSDSNWSQIACQFGYYDQAHFIKEFKHFLGQTPGAFKSEGWLMQLLAAKETANL